MIAYESLKIRKPQLFVGVCSFFLPKHFVSYRSSCLLQYRLHTRTAL